MIANDWAMGAANEIAEEVRHGSANEWDYRAIILKHCPMKEDTAYMPVPRCDSCRHWRRHLKTISPSNNDKFGLCEYFSMTTLEGFGCVQWEAK